MSLFISSVMSTQEFGLFILGVMVFVWLLSPKVSQM